MQHLEGLNDRQKEAVLHTDGPLLIIAGAGAGKTKTLVSRIAHLAHTGVPLSNILAVTFTNKAAKEMRERVSALLGTNMNPYGQSGFIGTFHSLGVRIIKENHAHFGLPRHFVIADEGDAMSLVKQALAKVGLDPKQYEPKKLRYIISQEKGKGNTPETYEGYAGSPLTRIVQSVWREYEALLKAENTLDFDDLLSKTVRLLEKDADVRARYREQWSHIHIDEYQDTNSTQYKIARLLAGEKQNICVVGDSDQSIYSWRGADISNILNFEKDYPGARTVLLEENYRSTKVILEAANEIIKKNTIRKEKNLFTNNAAGEKITVAEAYNETFEAEFVAQKAQELLASGVPGGEIAVLYRTNFLSRVLEEGLIKNNVPYQMLGVKFFERREIKDTLSYLRAALNPESLSDIKRIINFPARGIGKVTLTKLFAGQKDALPAKMIEKIDALYALLANIREFAQSHTPSEIIRHIVLMSGIEKSLAHGTEEDLERLENIKELATLAMKYDEYEGTEGVEKLMEDASLESDQDGLMREDYQTQAIRLMTVHASKGLEFRYVFVVGLEQDLFPHSRAGERMTKEAKEEERRLFYVALTRAREKLFLSWASIRTIFGSKQINAPSEFLYDIPEQIIDREYETGGGKVVYI